MSDFLSLLPPNATALEQALEKAVAQAGDVPVNIRDYWNADTVPENLMPWLGWEWSVDNWNPEWNETARRNVLRDAFRYHRHKGTRRSVEDAINSLGRNISMKEWWEYTTSGPVHTFDAVMDTHSGSSSGILQTHLIAAIDNAKPVRSHYTLKVATRAGGSLNIYGYGRVGRFQRLHLVDTGTE